MPPKRPAKRINGSAAVQSAPQDASNEDGSSIQPKKRQRVSFGPTSSTQATPSSAKAPITRKPNTASPAASKSPKPSVIPKQAATIKNEQPTDATASSSRAASPEPLTEPQKRTYADQLYNACLNDTNIKTWKQEDLLALNVVTDPSNLMALLQLLMKEEKFQSVSIDSANSVAFTVRPPHSASKYVTIKDANAKSIYKLIENSDNQGMWKGTIKNRLGLHENIVEKALKGLVSSKHVKEVKSSVRGSAKKVFMLAEAVAGKDVTGGGWFSDGELDYELVEVAARVVVNFVRANSWAIGPRLPKLVKSEKDGRSSGKRKREDGDEGGGSAAKKTLVNGVKVEGEDQSQAVAGAQEERIDFDEEAILELRKRAATDGRGHILIPFPTAHEDYPTVESVHDNLLASGIIQKDISAQDIEDLLERLVFDGLLEKMPLKRKKPRAATEEKDLEQTELDVEIKDDEVKDDEVKDDGEKPPEEDEEEFGYRWVRRPDSQWDGAAGEIFTFENGAKLGKNGLNEVPCFRCPQHRFCQEGGPVSAKNCKYFEEWF